MAEQDDKTRAAHDKLNAGLEMLRRLNVLQPHVLSTILAKHPTLRLTSTRASMQPGGSGSGASSATRAPPAASGLPIAELSLPAGCPPPSGAQPRAHE